jgi:glycosyltransferase involved in cell wall biosynthesis
LEVVEGVADMAGKLVATLRNPRRAREMADSGRRQVLDHYDWDVLADKLEQVWEKCLERTESDEADQLQLSTTDSGTN